MCIRDRYQRRVHGVMNNADNSGSKWRRRFNLAKKFLQAVYADSKVFYYLSYTILAFLGAFVDKRFTALLLYDLVYRTKILYQIFYSIYGSWRSFYLTLIFFLLIQFTSSIIAYTYFHPEFDYYCDRLWTCWFTIVDHSFKHDNGVGSFLNILASKRAEELGLVELEIRGIDQDVHLWRVLYDLLGFFIPVVIIIQLLTGIITDNFGALRLEQEKREMDIKYNCFICSISREYWEGTDTTLDFTYHIRHEHNMWHYLFYIAYLNSKSPMDYNGIETYVSGCISSRNVQMFPLQRALSLNHLEHKTSDEIDAATEYLNHLNDRFDRIEDKITTIKKRSLDFQG
eukprot:TRINITY_DN1483_c0_g2_i1.p1 TRINITY_DN1483_c0_g2~~TRINITY_DN1483_c0_g2_i1.p1  ORF type:complete len:362 (-),score=89.26 TRINITY_DN1483_c0_g2_i1:1343-2368(-)